MTKRYLLFVFICVWPQVLFSTEKDQCHVVFGDQEKGPNNSRVITLEPGLKEDFIEMASSLEKYKDLRRAHARLSYARTIRKNQKLEQLISLVGDLKGEYEKRSKFPQIKTELKKQLENFRALDFSKEAEKSFFKNFAIESYIKLNVKKYNKVLNRSEINQIAMIYVSFLKTYYILRSVEKNLEKIFKEKQGYTNYSLERILNVQLHRKRFFWLKHGFEQDISAYLLNRLNLLKGEPETLQVIKLDLVFYETQLKEHQHSLYVGLVEHLIQAGQVLNTKGLSFAKIISSQLYAPFDLIYILRDGDLEAAIKGEPQKILAQASKVVGEEKSKKIVPVSLEIDVSMEMFW